MENIFGFIIILVGNHNKKDYIVGNFRVLLDLALKYFNIKDMANFRSQGNFSIQ